MEIYEALKKDHDKVKQLLTDLINQPDKSTDTTAFLVKQIRDELIPHARAEESIFYNSLREVEKNKDLAMHAYKEHFEAESLLRLLQLEEKTSMGWKATAQKLKDALEHHIAEEENTMFPTAQNYLSSEEARMMAEAFENLKPKIRDQTIVGTTGDMVANLMPPRFSDSFKNGPQL